MKQRALHYPYLVDLQTIPGLNQITRENDGVRIGALATHRMVELSPLIRQAFPVVAEAFSKIGNVRVRQTASVGGNLAHADYRSTHRRRCWFLTRKSMSSAPTARARYRSKIFPWHL